MYDVNVSRALLMYMPSCILSYVLYKKQSYYAFTWNRVVCGYIIHRANDFPRLYWLFYRNSVSYILDVWHVTSSCWDHMLFTSLTSDLGRKNGVIIARYWAPIKVITWPDSSLTKYDQIFVNSEILFDNEKTLLSRVGLHFYYS